ncbi:MULTISPECIES: hypothetical protein [Bacillus]|uniref:hypothetical protein n=1 Tax=Bacillus TaxID=1386 RepID=UPI000317CF06|nr:MULTISPECIES: hypothetical protein [Bacillus]
MGIIFTLIAIALLGFAARNANLALRATSTSVKLEYWIGAAVCLVIALGILFYGCSSNNTSDDYDSNDSYESNDVYDSGNQNSTPTSHPWDSPLEKYKEEKKPWE